MVAAGKGATAGVRFRNAEVIEVLRSVDTTGTLTISKPQSDRARRARLR
jgi:P-type Cu+ transporter